MHSPALRIALLLTMAIAASVAATWAKAQLDGGGHSHPAQVLSGKAETSRKG